MTSAIALEAAQDTYLDLEQEIHKTVYGFMRRYGGNFGDLLGIAHEVFMREYDRHDQDKGDFEPWLKSKIWYGMLDSIRQTAKRAKTLTFTDVDYSTFAAPEGQAFEAADFMAELSEDARTIARLVLDTPDDIAAIIDQRGGEPRNIRSVVRASLIGLGWTSQRVSDSYAEIKAALK